MVSDITAAERKADEQRGGLLPSTRLQLSFGAHVLVTMFTFWAVAYYGTKMWFKYDELWVGIRRVLLLYLFASRLRSGCVANAPALLPCTWLTSPSGRTTCCKCLQCCFVVEPVMRSTRTCLPAWPSAPQAGLAGAVGLTLGLLVETGLLIIRSNRPEPLEDRCDSAVVNRPCTPRRKQHPAACLCNCTCSVLASRCRERPVRWVA